MRILYNLVKPASQVVVCAMMCLHLYIILYERTCFYRHFWSSSVRWGWWTQLGTSSVHPCYCKRDLPVWETVQQCDFKCHPRCINNYLASWEDLCSVWLPSLRIWWRTMCHANRWQASHVHEWWCINIVVGHACFHGYHWWSPKPASCI